MDIIASHRIGLVERHRHEAEALAGRDRDLVQRAIVYHHLYDHSAGRHGFALLCASGALELDSRLDRLAKSARRSRWRLGRAGRDALVERVAAFSTALRRIDRERCQAMLFNYRLALAPSLRREAADLMPQDLLAALREGSARALCVAQWSWADEHWGAAIEAAMADLAWPLRRKAVAAALAALLPTRADFDRAGRSGWEAVERRITGAPALPYGFAGNPARHYYALQRALADRRRRDSGPSVIEEVRVALAA